MPGRSPRTTTRSAPASPGPGVDLDAVTATVAAFTVAVPSWGVGTGGTRFARFTGPGEPRGIFQKLDDCAVIQQFGRAAPAVSLHVPWDEAPPAELRARADAGGAIDPIAAYRESRYRAKVAAQRPAAQGGGGGIT